MKKVESKHNDDLRPEYPREDMRGGVRGKYYLPCQNGSNLILRKPDVARFLILSMRHSVFDLT
jgi:hypothetical protein